mgnify:CR=1 FL=1
MVTDAGFFCSCRAGNATCFFTGIYIYMGVNVNVFPNTGVTLPLVSMGGSSFLFTCLSIGIILSVARNVEQLEGKEQPVIANE